MTATDRAEPARPGGWPLTPEAGRRADAWFSPWRFGVLLGLVVAFTFPLVLMGTRSFVFRDYGVLAYPFAFYQRRCFWHGELPLWNPLSNCGAPFLAQWGTMALYPLSLVYLLLPMPWSLGLFCLGHLWLGGLGMYFLARGWAGSRFGASLAGLVFVFNGVTLSCLLWPNYTVALGWMPWVVLWVERGWREGGRALFGAIAVATLQLLSGAPEVVVFTWLVSGAIWAGRWLTRSARRGLMAGRAAVVVLATAGLSAAQTLPFLDLLAHSQRGTGFATAKWALPGWGWADCLVPLFHCFESYQGVFFQRGQEFFSSCYLGVAPVMLALLAVGRVRRPRVWLLGGLVVASMILALGNNGMVYPWLRRCLPSLGFARYPVKFLLLTSFAVPLLAAHAVARLQSVPCDRWRREWEAVGGVAAVIGALMAVILWFAYRSPFPQDQWAATWTNAVVRVLFAAVAWTVLWAAWRDGRPGWRIAAQVAALIVLWIDVLNHTPSQNPTIASRWMLPGLVALKPRPRIGQRRVMISPRAEEHLLRSRVRGVTADFIGKRLALWSNLNALEGIPKINGSSTLQVREEAEVQSLLYATPNTSLPRLADFLGAAYITAPASVVDWTNRPTWLPWITTGQRPIFADAARTLRGLVQPGFDPRHVVYLPPAAKPFVNITQPTTARLVRSRFAAERVEAEVAAQAPSLVVIAQSFYHPWRAFVDGRPVPLWRANHAFQALEVPPGTHHVRLVYRDVWWHVGAAVSGATLLGLVTVWWRHGPGGESTLKDGTDEPG